jgi:hypothetical protein
MENKQRCVFMLRSLYSSWKSSSYLTDKYSWCRYNNRSVRAVRTWPCCVVCGEKVRPTVSWWDRECETVWRWERERERETEKRWDRRERERGGSETVRQTERRWDWDTLRQTGGETEKSATDGGERDGEGGSETVRQTERDGETVRQKLRQTGGETEKSATDGGGGERRRGGEVRRWGRQRVSERVRQRDRQWDGKCDTHTALGTAACTDTSFEARLYHLRVKDEAEIVSVYAMKACMGGSRGVAPLMLKLFTKWRWILGFTPLPLYPPGSLNNKLGWHQSRTGRIGEDRKLCFCQESKPGQPRPWPSRTDWYIPAPSLSASRKKNVNPLNSIDYFIYRQV